MTVAGLLLRGLAAGGIAGLVAGLFALVVAEPVIDAAVRLEAARVAAGGAAEHEVFSRGTQHGGLVLALVLAGLALGALFALAYRILPPTRGTSWQRSLGLGAGAFTAVYLVPFLRYPADPPGVGSSDTVADRTRSYLLALALGVLAVVTAYAVLRRLAARGVPAPVRQLAVAAGFVAVVTLGYLLLPSTRDPVTVPATLLWDFRLRSLATQLLLYAALAATFGLLLERAERRSA